MQENEQTDWYSIIERVRQGMTTTQDGDWLEQYHNRLIVELEQLKDENEKARQIICSIEWQFY